MRKGRFSLGSQMMEDASRETPRPLHGTHPTAYLTKAKTGHWTGLGVTRHAEWPEVADD